MAPVQWFGADMTADEPPYDRPCLARRGVIRGPGSRFEHFCAVCGAWGAFGLGVTAEEPGRWYCLDIGLRDRAEVTEAAACMWCGRAFTPHATGGRAQRFCRSACRRAFGAAGRHWVAEAIAGGTRTLDSLRNAAAATRVASRGRLDRLAIRASETRPYSSRG